MSNEIHVPTIEEEIGQNLATIADAKVLLKLTRDVKERCDLQVTIGRCTQRIRRLQLRQSGAY